MSKKLFMVTLGLVLLTGCIQTIMEEKRGFTYQTRDVKFECIHEPERRILEIQKEAKDVLAEIGQKFVAAAEPTTDVPTAQELALTCQQLIEGQPITEVPSEPLSGPSL